MASPSSHFPNGNHKPKPFSLAIVGGGIAGLCLAVALDSHHVPIHVYEAAAHFTEIGAGVGLGPNALRAMALLSPAIFDGYKRCETSHASPEERKRFFNFRYGMEAPSADGSMVANQLICDLRSDTETSSVHRARFLSELVNLLPPGAASAGKRLTELIINDQEEVDQRVLLKFADGTEARHDAVIGCDGIKSQVRKEMLGAHHEASEPVFSGKLCYRGLVPAEKAIEILGEDLALNSQMYLGHHGHVLTTLISHGKYINVVGYHSKADNKWDNEKWIIPTTREQMYSTFTGFVPTVRSIISLVEKPDIWALFDHLPSSTYFHKGKICLLGDAAHASTPHHGAGAGMAIEDAMILSRLLGEITSAGQLEAAFKAYDTVRRPRSQRLVESSRRVARVYDFEDEEVLGGGMGGGLAGEVGKGVNGEVGNGVVNGGTIDGEIRNGHDAENGNGNGTDDSTLNQRMKAYLSHAWDWIWKEDLDAQLEKAMGLLRGYLASSGNEIGNGKGDGQLK